MALISKSYPLGGQRNRYMPLLFLLPGLLLYLIIAFGPSLATIGYSFTDATGLRGLPVNWVGFENYDRFLFRGAASTNNLEALQRTLIFSFFVTTIQFGLGLAQLIANGLLSGLRRRTLFTSSC